MKNGIAGRTAEILKPTIKPPRRPPGPADSSLVRSRLLRRLREEERRITAAVEDMKTRGH